MPNLLDLMSEEDRQVAIDNYKQRMSGKMEYRAKVSISPEVYLISELGYHYGWGAIEAVKRGYVEAQDDKGNPKKIPLTMEEVGVLVEGARKVWYSKVIDSARGTLVANASAMSKNPASTFKKSMDVYAREIKLQNNTGKKIKKNPKDKLKKHVYDWYRNQKIQGGNKRETGKLASPFQVKP